MTQNYQQKENDEPFVSVLTPVYNGEEFLRECIESVLNQNYDNWEYVLVNNQSTDSSLQIMEEYEEKDERIRIHNNDDFLPQMENLNYAFRQISSGSEYCKVVHADDWLFPDCLTKMVEVAEEHPTVGIVSAYRLEGRHVDLDGFSYDTNVKSGEVVARQYLMQGTSMFGSPTSLLIRSDLIRKREKVYDESYLAADTGACLDILQESDFGFVHQVLTYTRLHENSATSKNAEENCARIHGLIKFQMEYGPHFLDEEEYQKSLKERLNLFYILLARNLFEEKSIRSFKQQTRILEELGLDFEWGTFLKNFIREIFLQSLRRTGFDIKKVNNA